ncbi:MAG: 1,4-alpha-glucan branching protein GlgB [Gammaproteobacteria bacterium]
MTTPHLTDQIARLVRGQCDDPFSILGAHGRGDDVVVRCFIPQAKRIVLLGADGTDYGELRRLHPNGVFEGNMPALMTYTLSVTTYSGEHLQVDDPYRFGSLLSDLDLHLIGEGTHEQLYRKLGATYRNLDGVPGTHFAVWAPTAHRVSVVGDFNDWDGRLHVLRKHHDIGIWDIFIPGIEPGALYKYELLNQARELLPLKSDPMAQACEPPPGNASRVTHSQYQWGDGDWMTHREGNCALDAPVSIYEVHLGSWRRHADSGACLSYEELADQLVSYVADMGFTHIELMPIHEHPFDGSWGYQPIGLYAPTYRFGTPDACRALIDRAHQRGIGVIIDWVAAHFPRDEHGLARFDGTCLYEHEDPRRGAHMDWGTLIFNLSRREVSNYLISNALYWIREFHIDALRVDAVASMLYLDYSREDGEWVANEHGGNENLEAIAFFAELNERVSAAGGVTMAEESTAWPMVSRPVSAGGLGFHYKWNLGWMHDTLHYLQEDPIARKHHHDKMTFGLIYAFSENFILPLSHDEVVHGKHSLVDRIPGDLDTKLATLRAYYGFMYAHPGKKLLFMGGEFAQRHEWQFDQQLHWHLLDDAGHSGVQSCVRALNGIYREHGALHTLDADAAGFEWLVAEDRDHSVYAFMRYDSHGDRILCISNFTPVARAGYRVGVPFEGAFSELFNTASKRYAGSDSTPPRLVESEPVAADARDHSIKLDLPPLATLYLRWSQSSTSGTTH